MRVIKTGYGNKLIFALLSMIQSEHNASIGEIEEMIFEFIATNKDQYRRNHPEFLSVLRSQNELMIAYTNAIVLQSQIEVFFN